MWPISVPCEVLEVSRSGFYASQQRTRRGVVDHERQDLVAWVQAIAASTRYSYGSNSRSALKILYNVCRWVSPRAI